MCLSKEHGDNGDVNVPRILSAVLYIDSEWLCRVITAKVISQQVYVNSAMHQWPEIEALIYSTNHQLLLHLLNYLVAGMYRDNNVK